MKKLYVVDVSSMFFRAFYAIPPLNNSKGLPTNALYGFLSMTLKLLRDIKPDYVAFCFDRKDGSFRNELYPDYKANRGEMPEDLVPQIPYVRKLTQLLGILDIDAKGFEADDVIGTLAQIGRDHDLEVVIVSGDKDFAQLVGPYVTMYDTMREKKYDVDGVVEKWGVKPEQMIDYLAMVGDSSDNVPGIKGIGPKGAQKLLAEFKDLEGIFENVDKISGKSLKAKVEEGQDMAYLSKELVTIATSIELGVTPEELKLKPINKDKLRQVLQELEFNTFERNLIGSNGAGTKENIEKTSAKKKASAKKSSSQSKSKSPKNIQDETWTLKELEKNVEPYSEIWGIDSERGTVFGVGDKAVMVDGDLEKVGDILGAKHLEWKGYQLKKFWKSIKMPTPAPPAWDAMLAAYICRAGNIESFDQIYQRYTNEQVPDLAGPAQLYEAHLRLEPLLKDKLEKVAGDKVLQDIELPLVPVLYEMESNGIFLDSDQLSTQSKLLEKDIAKIEKKIHKEAGESFNVASTKQLGSILFEKMKIPPGKKTKTGFSTSSDVLEKLAPEYPIAISVIEFRELSKLKSTYVDALPALANKQTGKIHTFFRQAATATGRLSSINPNLQNIPIRTERGRLVRKAFRAQKGHLFLSADYSQIELRVLAHITDDPGLCKAFASDQDIHAATAAEVFDVPLGEVTSELRRKAKAVNFGIAYGQGVFGLSETLGIPRGEASDIIERYYLRFKKVREYMGEIVDRAKADGYVETLFGRRRYIDELKSSNGNMRKFGERAAINAPIQGTASDLVKLAMIKLFDEVSIDMLLQVHDEILFECPEEEIEEQAQLVKEIMETTTELKVPLRVNVAWGKSWEDAHA